jgi:quinol monooxygenase YgiN
MVLGPLTKSVGSRRRAPLCSPSGPVETTAATVAPASLAPHQVWAVAPARAAPHGTVGCLDRGLPHGATRRWTAACRTGLPAEGSATMVTVGLLVRLLAKPGKEAEVTSFLEGGLALVEEEPATTAWFAIRLGPSEFGIFDAFPDDAGRQAHLGGQVAAALMAQAPELLERPPVIEPVDVIAAKLPG